VTSGRGAARIFLRRGWSYGNKSFEKEKLLVIRIVKESTYDLWINNWLFSPRKLGVLPNKLPSCFFGILSWRPQNSTNLIACLNRVLFWSMTFFLLSEIIFLTSTLPSFLQNLWNAWNFSAQNLSSFAFFQFLWADFAYIPRALADNIRCKRTQHTFPKWPFMNFTVG